jgi:hypothetical protein
MTTSFWLFELNHIIFTIDDILCEFIDRIRLNKLHIRRDKQSRPLVVANDQLSKLAANIHQEMP